MQWQGSEQGINHPITVHQKPTNSNFTASIQTHENHVIINNMGGIATANIYFAHFDDNNMGTLTNGIAHSLHKS
jgi:hypothetical protein